MHEFKIVYFVYKHFPHEDLYFKVIEICAHICVEVEDISFY